MVDSIHPGDPGEGRSARPKGDSPAPFSLGSLGEHPTLFSARDEGIVFKRGDIVAERFEVHRAVGGGGMGIVYKVTDTHMEGQEKALKVILPSLMRSVRAQERFVQEARIAQQLAHPNIVNTFDMGIAKGIRFLTMEYLRGSDLGSLLVKRTRLPFAYAIEVAKQALQGLIYAHQTTIHRDIKPQNVFICRNGAVKLLDFGLARIVGSNHFTRSSVAVGTAAYMAPEQLEGHDATIQSDLYSIGVVLYQCVTGRLPLGRFKLPGEITPGVPRWFDELIAVLLEPEPQDRPQQAGVVRHLLVQRTSGIQHRITLEPEVAADLESEEQGKPVAPWGGARGNRSGTDAARAKAQRLLSLMSDVVREVASGHVEAGNQACRNAESAGEDYARATAFYEEACRAYTQALRHAEAQEAAAQPRPGPAPAPGKRRRLWAKVLVAGVMVLFCAVGLSAWIVWPRVASDQPAGRSAPPVAPVETKEPPSFRTEANTARTEATTRQIDARRALAEAVRQARNAGQGEYTNANHESAEALLSQAAEAYDAGAYEEAANRYRQAVEAYGAAIEEAQGVVTKTMAKLAAAEQQEQRDAMTPVREAAEAARTEAAAAVAEAMRTVEAAKKAVSDVEAAVEKAASRAEEEINQEVRGAVVEAEQAAAKVEGMMREPEDSFGIAEEQEEAGAYELAVPVYRSAERLYRKVRKEADEAASRAALIPFELRAEVARASVTEFEKTYVAELLTAAEKLRASAIEEKANRTYREAAALYKQAAAKFEEARQVAQKPLSGSQTGEKRTFAGFEMVWIEPGSYVMGTPANTQIEVGREPDETQHEVRITSGFWIGAYEVTRVQWTKHLGEDPSVPWRNLKQPERQPVVRVSWHEVQRFVERVNTTEGGGKFRLPTEAEWEFACRAGTTTPFACGDLIVSDRANYDGRVVYGKGLDKKSNRDGHYLDRTSPAGSYPPPNDWGLFDMHGNVWEWCDDWYGAYPTGSAVDPTGPAQPISKAKVRRGGGWRSKPHECRSGARDSLDPGYIGDDIGFRLVRVP